MLRYHEIAIKGQNRGWFEERLGINARRMIQRTFDKSTPVEVNRIRGRVILETHWDEATRETLERVFGISSFSPMRKVKTDKQTILSAALEEFETYVKARGLPKTFCVQTRRSDKVFPEPSMELNRWIGSEIHDRYPSLVVDLEDPEFTLGIELRFNESFIWTEKFLAQGGLPVGTNGKILSLISGGLDSPIAAIQTLKRGSPVSFIHFYGTPFVGPEALEKVEDLVRIVNRFQPEPQPLYVVPFGKIQEKIALATNPKMRTLLYRRMMVRISNAAAKQISALALVTGESLGQVASQTVENISIVNAVSELPILRPLITFDKDEIIAKAHRWATFETSVRPAADCCTLFADRHPILRATASLLEEQEERFPVDELVAEAVAQIEIRRPQ
jgi:thiamine biosynthesis protein ThiI